MEKKFANGIVYAMETEDGYPIEVTDTFLPYYTKDAIGRKQNALHSGEFGSRLERWMIGVSVMSGCPVGCKFCATASLPKCRYLRSDEIISQVKFILGQHPEIDPNDCMEFKINYTRMGEPFLNILAVQETVNQINSTFPNAHHYVSTIGIKDSDFSWIRDNITLQFSVHSFDEQYRDWLIPFPRKMSLEEIGKIRTESNLKTTINLTLVREDDFSIQELKRLFDPKIHFIKLSPINQNCVSDANNMGAGIITQTNLI
ncbi:MAG: radical SAM protein [Anaerolineales bacterium]|nr:radical SAM protein [Anaerolineales bacterium]